MRIGKEFILALSIFATLSLSSTTFAYSSPNDVLDDAMDLYDANRYLNASDKLGSLVKSRDFRKLDYLEKSLALTYLIDSKLQQGKARSALAHTKGLISIVERGFGRLSMEHVNAHFMKAKVQYRIGNGRDAARSVDSMVEILERMGDEYSEDVSDARRLATLARRGKQWDQEKLYEDLSEFYTQCESIKDGDKLPAASRVMSDFLLVGSDYKPTGRTKQQFKSTYIQHARENAKDRANRLVFIPDEDHLDHWCVIYPGQKGLVDRAITSPPKDK